MAAEYPTFVCVAPPPELIDRTLHEIWPELFSNAYDNTGDFLSVCSRGACHEELMLYLCCLYNKPNLVFLGAIHGLDSFTPLLQDRSAFMPTEVVQQNQKFMDTPQVKRYLLDPTISASIQHEIENFNSTRKAFNGNYVRYFDHQACFTLATAISELFTDIQSNPDFYTEVAEQVGGGLGCNKKSVTDRVIKILSEASDEASVRVGSLHSDTQYPHEFLTLEFLAAFRELLMAAQHKKSGVLFFQQY